MEFSRAKRLVMLATSNQSFKDSSKRNSPSSRPCTSKGIEHGRLNNNNNQVKRDLLLS